MTPTITFWWQLFGLLAIEAALIAILAAVLARWIESAVWRRTIWQAGALGLLVLAAGEATGLNRGLAAWATAKPEAPSPRRMVVRAFAPRIQAAPPIASNDPEVAPGLKTADAPTANSNSRTWWPGLIWLIGFGLMLGRNGLARFVLLLVRHRRRAVTDELLLGRVRDLSQRLGIRRRVRVTEANGLSGPIASGLFRPEICLPERFAGEFTVGQQEAMLAHELAHVAARDPAWYWLGDLAAALWWWHPLAWWTRGKLQATSEQAADEASLLIENGPDALAESLVEIGRRLTRRQPFGRLGIEGNGFRSGLGQRVARLLELSGNPWRRVGRVRLWLARASGLAGLAVIVLAGSAWSLRPRGETFQQSWQGSLVGYAWNALSQPSPKILLAQAAPPPATATADEGANRTAGVPARSAPPTQPAANDPRRQAIYKKLDQIILDDVAFDAPPLSDGLPLAQVLRLLSQYTRDKDPDGRGVNFILVSAPVFTTANPSTELPAPEPKDLNQVTVRIDKPLHHVKLTNVLEAIVLGANRPIEYQVEQYAVVFSTKGLHTRWFKVDPNTFPSRLRDTLGTNSIPATSTNAQAPLFLDLRRWLKAMGVDLPPPISIWYDDRLGQLMVRATSQDLDAIEQAIQVLNASPPQVIDEQANSSPADPTKAQVPNGEVLHTRWFKIDPDTSVQGLRDMLGTNRFPANPTNAELATAEGLRDFIKAIGVDLAPPKSIFYSDRRGQLMVRATLQDLEVIEQAVQVLNTPPPQVTIEVKFAEVSEDENGGADFLAAIGYEQIMKFTAPTTSVPPHTASQTDLSAPIFTGILTPIQFRVIVRAMEQRKGVDLISAPRVTTLSGRQAQFKGVDLRYIVTGSTNSQNGLQPIAEPIEFGSVLDVTPYVAADGYTIQLTMIPTVRELLGYDLDASRRFPATSLPGVEQPPEADAKAAEQFSGATPFTSATPLPIFRLRQVCASAVVWDGQTVVLGPGSIEVEAKSQHDAAGPTKKIRKPRRDAPGANKKIRKHLLVFVTPTIIDPAGNRVHSDEELPFRQNAVPPQKTGE